VLGFGGFLAGPSPFRRDPAGRGLTLRLEYQALLASSNLKPSEATELVRLSPRGQDTLFNAIRTGCCRNDYDLRASSTALVNAEAQLLLMPDASPPPTKEDRELASAFEAHVERVAALLRSGIHENQIVAVRKTSPHRGACPCEGGGHPGRLAGRHADRPAPDRGRAARGRHPGEFPRPSRLTGRRRDRRARAGNTPPRHTPHPNSRPVELHPCTVPEGGAWWAETPYPRRAGHPQPVPCGAPTTASRPEPPHRDSRSSRLAEALHTRIRGRVAYGGNDMSELRRQYFATLGLSPKQQVGDASVPCESPREQQMKAALARAHLLRSFEIEHYWKRATYFWAFQVAIFAAFGLLWRQPAANDWSPITVALAGLGVLTAVANTLSARGSRFWQENWEHHIDMLEDTIEGRLYKTVWLDKGTVSFSVSRINLYLSSLLSGEYTSGFNSLCYIATPYL